MTRQRLDAELVRRKLVDSRTDAVQLISSGRVLVNGSVADKASRQVASADAVVLLGPPPRYVSRGGLKLEAAIDSFALQVHGVRALDAGASTGGFTDCLLQHGALHVVAADVGHGQLHPRIRHDARVCVVERVHLRDLKIDDYGGAVDMVVADLSFISLTNVIQPLLASCQPGGTMVLLVKPQFEAGRRDVSRGKGVITDGEVRQAACDRVVDAYRAVGCEVKGLIESPISGGDGNREYLLWLTAPLQAASHG